MLDESNKSASLGNTTMHKVAIEQRTSTSQHSRGSLHVLISHHTLGEFSLGLSKTGSCTAVDAVDLDRFGDCVTISTTSQEKLVT
ncbi:hypothetical protein E2C01_049656 [Portunus trituberculatus]|uniref:Uncharacterized protein n=1 Tax=Portunus trituberculatus TaxID=210409 RepID=A0A5B7GA21_PORTR|nr:hypothetical protein [Portunus trituberculatus]